MRTRMRAAAALTATIVGCAVGVIGSVGTASAAVGTTIESGITLPFSNVGDVVVDSANGYVFVSGGSASTYIDVLNRFGQAVGEIQHQGGANGLALSADGGTLYAADSTADTIAVINASTLTQITSYATGATPQYVAITGGNLWFSTSGDSYVHEVALASGQVSTTSADTSYTGSMLITSPADPDLLITGTAGIDPPTVDEYDVSSGAPVYTVGEWLGTIVSGGCAFLDGWAVTPDGKSLDLACGAPYYGFQLPLSTLNSVQQTYTTGAYPGSIDVSSDGEVLIGVSNQSHSVLEFSPGDSTAVGFYGAASSPGGPAFVKWGADDSEFYEVLPGPSGAAIFETFRVGVSPGFALSLPAAAFPNSTFKASGRLTVDGSALPGAEVTVTRLASGATTTVGTFTTDSKGAFSFTGTSGSAFTTTTYTATIVGTTPTLTASGTITTVPVKVPVSKPPVRTPVKAVSLAVRR